MGKSNSKNNKKKNVKTGKKTSRRASRQDARVRQLVVLGGVGLICVLCLIMMASLNRPLDHQTSWRVEDGALNVEPAPTVYSAAADDAFEAPAYGADTLDAEDDPFVPPTDIDADDAPDLAEDMQGEDAFDAEAYGDSASDIDDDAGDFGAFDEEAANDAAPATDDAVEQGIASFSDAASEAASAGMVPVQPLATATALPSMITMNDQTAPLADAASMAEPAQATPVRLTITAAGDCTFGGCLKHDTFKVFKKYVDDYGFDYFFRNVLGVFQNDDLSIINLEGPLTDVGTMTTKSGICFRGEPQWTAIMANSSIELCNFANNHNMDMGQEGFDRTLQALDAAQIGYCVYDKVYHATIKGVRITALGFDKWANKKEEVVAAVQRERPNCDLLIVNIHWGREMHYGPMKDQKAMGHAIIDAGADLVIGTHPHVYSGVELYNGKYIAYSLGNFCFGGNTKPRDQRAMIFQQVFEFTPGSGVSDGGINIIPCMVSGTTAHNDFQPYIMDAKAGTALLKKIAYYSINMGQVRWMPGSYPEQIGLLGGNADATEDAAVTATPSPSPSPSPTPVLIPASEVFTEEDGFDVDTAPQTLTTVEPLNAVGERTLTTEEAAAFQEQIYQDQMSAVG